MAKQKPAPVEAPEPVAVSAAPDPPEPDPAITIVLDRPTGQTIVEVEHPHARLQCINGQTWEHVSEDLAGRWVYRVN